MPTPATPEAAMDDVHPAIDTFDDESPTTLTQAPILDLDFVRDPRPANTTMSESQRTVLEVHQTWRDTVINSLHVRSGAVTAGTATGFRWKLMGQDIAWVPSPLARILPFTPPMLSEVEPQVRADLHLPHPAATPHKPAPIFRERPGGWTAIVQDGVEACLRDDEGLHDLDALVGQGRARREGTAHHVDLEPGDHLCMAFGEIELHARPVPAAKRVGSSIFNGWDPVFLGLLAMSGMLAACFGLVILALPGSPESSYLDLADHVGVMLRPTEVEEPPPAKVADGSQAAAPKASPSPESRTASRRPNPDPRAAQAAQEAHDREVAMDSGLLGAFQDDRIALGMGGSVDASALDGLTAIVTKGVGLGGGLGNRVSGLGGNGTTEGIGGFGPSCVPGRTCAGNGGPNGVGSRALGRKRQGVIDTTKGGVTLIGSVDRSQIEQVIKRNINKFRYCYQRQLTRDPSLSGKVVTRFVIAGDGSVSKSETKSSSVSPAVDQCVARTMQRLTFPAPKGGGIAIVSYPFLFSSE